MNRNIELIRYSRFGEDLLLLDLVNAASADSVAMEADTPRQGGQTTGPADYKTISQVLEELDDPMRDLYEELRAHLLAMGDDVQEKITGVYVAFKRLKNFACVEIRPVKGSLLMFLKINPDTIVLEEGFSRDVREIGHLGTGDLELTLDERVDVEKAKALIQRSYDAS